MEGFKLRENENLKDECILIGLRVEKEKIPPELKLFDEFEGFRVVYEVIGNIIF